jgi:hypothetical protein
MMKRWPVRFFMDGKSIPAVLASGNRDWQSEDFSQETINRRKAG